MTILKTALKQRKYDGKWERIALILDDRFKFDYTSPKGHQVTMLAPKWVTLGVYDMLCEMV